MRHLCTHAGRTLLLALLASGCAAPEDDEVSGPALTGLIQNQVVVGQTIEVLGQDLAPAKGEDPAYRVAFEGQFIGDDGQTEPVALVMNALYDGKLAEQDVLRVSRFGPFKNPFSRSERPGRFVGKISLLVEGEDGVVKRSKGADVDLGVGPSLFIDALEPIDADCGAPALRGLPGIPYRLTVHPTGLQATRFVYQVSGVNGADGVVEFVHEFDGPVESDTLGVDELLAFNPIAQGQQSYVAGIRVLAYDDQNRAVETALPFSIHNPLEVRVNPSQSPELAERYQPVPVSGCIPGSVSTQVSYSESTTETRQKSVSLTVSHSWSESTGQSQTVGWQEGISEGESQSQTISGSTSESETSQESYGVSYSNSEANNVGVSTTDGESWSWNMREGESESEFQERMERLYGDASASTTLSASAEGSVPGLAKVSGKVSTTVGVTAGASTGSTEGQSRTQTSERGYTMGGSASETQGFGSTTTESESGSVNSAYTLSSSRQRSESDTAARQTSRTWNMGESTTDRETVTQGISEAEQKTWVSTSSDTTVLSFTGLIPRSKVGIFYRQTTRYVRRAEVLSYNLCGLAEHVGELQFNSWQWAPDLALASSCEDSLPPTSLPPAACFIEPCGG